MRWVQCVTLLVILVFLAAGAILAQSSPPPQQTDAAGARTTIDEFIGAFHRGDYRRALDLTYDTKNIISRIQTSQPKILWDKLIQEAYAPMIACVPRTIRYRNTANIFDDPGGCMPASLRELIFWFPKSAEWEVLEIRRTEAFDFSSGDFKATQVYLKVRYPTIADASGLGDRSGKITGALRETIFSFLFRDGLIARISRVSDGDVMYSSQSVSSTQAIGSKASAGEEQQAAVAVTFRNNYRRTVQVVFDGESPSTVRFGQSVTREMQPGTLHSIQVMLATETPGPKLRFRVTAAQTFQWTGSGLQCDGVPCAAQ